MCALCNNHHNNFKLPLPPKTMDENFQQSNYFADPNSKLRDIEDKQRILKDRLVLIGENLLELKEKTSQEMIDIKKQLSEISSTMERLKNFMENISEEFPKFARKEDLNILTKQAKMFQPLEFVRFSDLEKLKKK